MKLDPYKYNRIKLRARYRYENRYTTQGYLGTFMPHSVNRNYRPHKHTWPLPPGFLDKVVGQPRTIVEDYIRVRTQVLSSDKRAAIRNYLRDMVREDMFLCMGVPCYYTERGITPIPRGVYYYHEDVLYLVPVLLLPNGRRRLSPYRKCPYLDRHVDALYIHQPVGPGLIQQTMRAIYIVHTGESYEDLEPFEESYPDPNPPALDQVYRYMDGHFSTISAIWWATDLQVIPHVGWYIDTVNERGESVPYGMDAKVVRIKLCRDHVLINCRVVYEEG